MTHETAQVTDDTVELDVQTRFQSFRLPQSREEKDALLDDPERLREACETYAAALGISSSVGVRAMGRVVAHIHKEFNLPLPSDDVLYSEIMARTTSCGTFAATYHEFVSFVQDVLRQCLQDVPLAKKRPLSASLPTKPAAAPDGLIMVSIQRLSGETIEVQVDDSESVEAFAAQVEAEFAISSTCQQFINGVATLEPNQPLYEQGVTSGTVLSVVHVVPQATLLRIRRCNLGNAGASSRLGRSVSTGRSGKACAAISRSEQATPSAPMALAKAQLPVQPLVALPSAPVALAPSLAARATSQTRRSAAHKGGRRVFCEHRPNAAASGP